MDEKERSNQVESGTTRDAQAIDTISPAASKDFDETYQVYKSGDVRDVDPREARRVLRKIEFHIMPLLMGTYMLQYLDKSSINFAAVFGLEEGTHLTGQDYAW
jgi:hypothetical protein